MTERDALQGYLRGPSMSVIGRVLVPALKPWWRSNVDVALWVNHGINPRVFREFAFLVSLYFHTITFHIYSFTCMLTRLVLTLEIIVIAIIA